MKLYQYMTQGELWITPVGPEQLIGRTSLTVGIHGMSHGAKEAAKLWLLSKAHAFHAVALAHMGIDGNAREAVQLMSVEPSRWIQETALFRALDGKKGT